MIARSIFLGLTWSALALLPTRSADLPEQKLPVLGGTGGESFTRSCGAGKVLTGFRHRTGLVVDAIGLLCRPVNSDGSLGAETTVGTLVGGSGGTTGFSSCESGTVLTRVRIHFRTYVDGVRMFCSTWNKSTRSTGDNTSFPSFGRTIINTSEAEECEMKVQPAVAIRGRAAGVVDAFGMICNEP